MSSSFNLPNNVVRFEIKSRGNICGSMRRERVETYRAFSIQDHLLSSGLISCEESPKVAVVIKMDNKCLYIKEGSSQKSQ